jgi:phosphomannomutase
MKTSHNIITSSLIRFGTSGVRGLVVDMTDEACFAYTLAFLQTITPQLGSRVALAMDLRPSSPDIARVCAAAIRYAGFEVDFCGILPTPALAFYAGEQGIAAVMVTGSHIPFDRNGIKFYRANGEITKQDEADIILSGAIMPEVIGNDFLPDINHLAYQCYVDRYVTFFPEQPLAGLRLGFYEHSSAARDILGEILQILGAEVISIGRTDEFVPIDTEAVSDIDAKKARQWALDYNFDAILSTDGDADRPLLSDENGYWLRGDILGILCASYLGVNAVVTPVSSNTALELCQHFTVMRTRIGSPFVIAGMESLIAQGHSSVVGFEANGGFFVATTQEKQGRSLKPLPTRDAVLPMIALLVMTKERNINLSALLNDLPARYTASDRLVCFATEKSQALLGKLASSLSAVDDLLGDLCGVPVNQDQTDGLRLFFENGDIVHFRPSGNAPELRCYAEADSQLRANQLVMACLSRLL